MRKGVLHYLSLASLLVPLVLILSISPVFLTDVRELTVNPIGPHPLALDGGVYIDIEEVAVSNGSDGAYADVEDVVIGGGTPPGAPVPPGPTQEPPEANLKKVKAASPLSDFRYNIEVTSSKAEITIEDMPVKKVELFEYSDGANISFDTFPYPGFLQAYAIDPRGITGGRATVVAKGSSVYKCKDWNFTTRTCHGDWVFLKSVVPGQEYTIDIDPFDPAYGESGPAWAFDDNGYDVSSNVTSVDSSYATEGGTTSYWVNGTWTTGLSPGDSVDHANFTCVLSASPSTSGTVKHEWYNSTPGTWMEACSSSGTIPSSGTSYICDMNGYVNDEFPNPSMRCSVSLSSAADVSVNALRFEVNDPPISSCGTTISSSGYYYVTGDLSATGHCITITSNDVELNCQGHTLTGDGDPGDYGIFLSSVTSNVTVRDCEVAYFEYGVGALQSSDALIRNTTARDGVGGFAVAQGSSGITMDNNTAYNNTGNGFLVTDAWGACSNVHFTGCLAYNTSDNGFSIGSENCTVTGSTAHDVENNGLVADAYGINVTNSTFHSARDRGMSVRDSDEFNGTNIHLYNNSLDIQPYASVATPFNIELHNLTLDNPDGDFSDYTSLTIIDTVSGNSQYILNWSAQPTASPPDGYISFSSKYINISNPSGTVSIDAIRWNWETSELSGYDEDYFEVWLHNSTGWGNQSGQARSVSGNYIEVTNLIPHSEYGILQNESHLGGCTNIDSSGYYVLESDVSSNGTCLTIDAVDVVLNCNGHTITGNGSGSDSGYGISLTGNADNAIIENCSIKSYYYGIYTVVGAFSNTFRNNVVYNPSKTINGRVGMWFAYSSSYTVENNTVYNMNNEGIRFYGGTNNEITDNHIYNASYGLYWASATAAGYKTIARNTIHGTTTAGLYLNYVDLANITDTHLYDNTYSLDLQGHASNTFTVNATNLTLDNDAGSFENYSSLDIDDVVEASVRYRLDWAAQPDDPPPGYTSFARKYFVGNTVSASPKIDSLKYTWEDGELSGYAEGYFSVWEHSGSWAESANQTLNASGNYINMSYVSPSATYGILQGPPSVVENVTLNSTWQTNYTNENLTVHYDSYSPDGYEVKNITNFFVDGAPYTTVNMPFEANDGSESTLTKDYSNLSNNGTVTGATWSSTSGYDGWGAYTFVGAENDYISIPFDESFNPRGRTFAVSARIKTSADGYILHTQIAGGQDYYSLYVSGGKPVFKFSAGDAASTATCTGTTSVNDGEWHHIVGVRPVKEQCIIYVDGDYEDEDTHSGSLSAINPDQPLNIGRKASTDYFTGVIDEVKYFNRSISPLQVSALWNNMTDTVHEYETRAGETWQSCVTPNDRIQDGYPQPQILPAEGART